MATDHRSAETEVNTTFRSTVAEREQLKRTARAEGYDSVQAFMEARLLGAVKPKRRPGPQRSQREELPLTG